MSASRRKWSVLLTLLFVTTTICAQKITGIIRDKTSTPISYAMVVLCNVADTTHVDYTITDSLGNFSLQAKELDNLLLYISWIGYKPQYLPPKENMVVVLEQDAINIGEVVVKGSHPISKVTAEGVQTSIANTVLSDVGTGNDVLKRIPMVSGDDGSFEVFGRGVAKIYINNREVRDPSELDNLNSIDIQNIEVISNPGAKYDASTKAVINIKTIKKQGDGFSINARSSFYTWHNQDYINQINANYRNGGLDIFANLYYSNTRSYQKGNISQTVTIDTLWNQQNNMSSDMYINSLNATMGINYQITTKHSLGLKYDLKSSLDENIQDLKMYSKIYANNKLYGDVYNNEYQRTKNKPKSQINLYYNGEINKLKIDFNYDFLINRDEINSVNSETSKEFNNNTIISNSVINNMISAAKLQVAYPIWKGDLMVGSEYVYLKRSDNYTRDFLSSYVNLFENNFALFIQYILTSEKMGSVSVGLRYEDSRYDYYIDEVKDSDKSKLYKQWLPSVSYSKRLGEAMIKLDYGSKVTRPLYNQLGTSLLYGNRLTLLSGNPYLKPTLSHDMSLTAVWKFLQAQVNYAYQKDAITMWIDRYKKDPKISIVTYQNLDLLQKLSAFIGFSDKFGPWKPLLSLGIQKQWLNLDKYGIEKKLNDPVYTISLDNTFEFKNGYIFNLDGKYTSKGAYQTSYSYKDCFELNFGVSKYFFKDVLQIRLAVTDILNQKVTAYQTYSPQTYMKTLFYYDTRKISISFRYYFNSTNSRYKGSGAGSNSINRL